MTPWTECTREELDSHLAEYGDLHRDVAGMFEPPLISWNDFSEGKMWPESMVAKSREVWDATGVPTETFQYWIRS